MTSISGLNSSTAGTFDTRFDRSTDSPLTSTTGDPRRASWRSRPQVWTTLSSKAWTTMKSPENKYESEGCWSQ